MRSLRAQALQWLAQREHSRAELQRKLLQALQAQAVQTQTLQGQTNPEDDGALQPDVSALQMVAQLLDELQASGYLSEARFIESRIHHRAQKWGVHRIQQEMRQHHIAIPPEAMDALKQTELARAREVWQRKFSAAASTAAERAKQTRFLMNRGFSTDTIQALFKAHSRSHPSTDDT